MEISVELDEAQQTLEEFKGAGQRSTKLSNARLTYAKLALVWRSAEKPCGAQGYSMIGCARRR